MRALGVDLGARRVGLALSDATGLLARPFKTLTVTPADLVDRLAAEIRALAAEDDGLGVIVVGVPRRLDGAATPATARTQATIDEIRTRTTIPVVGEDERLTSHEAEQQLAVRERDWRRRKAQLDAVAAAIFLQDFLDRHHRSASDVGGDWY